MSDNPPALPQRGDEDFERQAADGSERLPSVVTMTDLILMLRDGAFNQQVAPEIQEFSEKLEGIGCDSDKKKVKGTITLKIDVERDHDGLYFFTPTLDFKLPKQPYGRTVGWVTHDNRFTPNAPSQGNLFGAVREVKTTTEVR